MCSAIRTAIGPPFGLPEAKHRRKIGEFDEFFKRSGFGATELKQVARRSKKYSEIVSKDASLLNLSSLSGKNDNVSARRT
jgi:hypothetical protein